MEFDIDELMYKLLVEKRNGTKTVAIEGYLVSDKHGLIAGSFGKGL